MPILWRYLLRNYLQVQALCISGFISILLVTRFQTIARFAATGSSSLHTLKFIALQIPFILPLAIPVSCLISSLILFQRMSRTQELTSLRASGMGLLPIAFPVLLSGLFMALLNFSIVSELAPKSRSLSKGLIYQMTAVNPLSLLQKDTLIKLKNTYVDMKVLRSGKYARDVCFIMPSYSNQRLGMMLAKKLSLEEEQMIGKDVTFISSIDPKTPDCFDHLVIENQGEMETGASQLAKYLKSNEWNIGYEALNLRMVQAKHRFEKPHMGSKDPKAMQEICRRVSLGLAAFCFTVIGIAFGIENSRNQKLSSILWSASLLVFYLISFVAAKSMKHSWGLCVTLYLMPHPILLLLSWHRLKKIRHGGLS